MTSAIPTLGMRVIMDFVPNHSSKRHPFFIDSQKLGEASPYYNFYDRDGQGNHRYYFDWEHLPNFNFKNPQMVEMIEKAFLYWLKNYNIDGFRIDVAWGVRERAPEFWPSLHKKLKAVKKDVILLAEGPAHDSYYFRNGFDVAYDWGAQLGVWSWKDVFSRVQGLSGRLSDALSTEAHSGPRTLRFLNNNDTGRRFITRFGLPRTRLAVILQHTVPGIALVFTGDEVGAEYEPYEDPPPLLWTDVRGLSPLYRRLADLRETLPALGTTEWAVVPTSPDGAVFAYFRGKGATQILVVLNFGAKTQFYLDLKNPHMGTNFKNRLHRGKLRDALTGTAVQFRESQQRSAGQLQVPSRSALILN